MTSDLDLRRGLPADEQGRRRDAPAPDDPGDPGDPGGQEPSLAWLTIRLIGRIRAHHVARLAAFGLSIPEANVLLHLHPGASMPMSRLADLMAYDKSNLTTVMTKLERRGLVDRDPATTDRRIRLMRLTPTGEQARAAIDMDLSRDSPLTRGLDDADRLTLTRILARLGLDDA